MHDPMSVAFEIRYPWRKYLPWPKQAESWEDIEQDERKNRSQGFRDGYRESFATIWHVDPCTDGSDSSCWNKLRQLKRKHRQWLKSLAWDESRNRYFLHRKGREFRGSRHEAECMYRGLILRVARCIELDITFDQAAKMASEEIHNPDCCDRAKVFTFEAGYHTNFEEDTDEHRRDYFEGVVFGLARELMTRFRPKPWWRSPKLHFWHWKINISLLMDFKRWAFSRCCKCGGRFKFGESPCTNQWDGTGPLWFRSEENTYHSTCAGTTQAGAA